jgi:hypothetical protein
MRLVLGSSASNDERDGVAALPGLPPGDVLRDAQARVDLQAAVVEDLRQVALSLVHAIHPFGSDPSGGASAEHFFGPGSRQRPTSVARRRVAAHNLRDEAHAHAFSEETACVVRVDRPPSVLGDTPLQERRNLARAVLRITVARRGFCGDEVLREGG